MDKTGIHKLCISVNVFAEAFLIPLAVLFVMPALVIVHVVEKPLAHRLRPTL